MCVGRFQLFQKRVPALDELIHHSRHVERSGSGLGVAGRDFPDGPIGAQKLRKRIGLIFGKRANCPVYFIHASCGTRHTGRAGAQLAGSQLLSGDEPAETPGDE